MLKPSKHTTQIRTFLAAPENLEILKSYEATAEEFQMKIISKRKDFQNFDAVMEYLLDLLFQRDPILRQKQHKRLTRAVLFYMYWNALGRICPRCHRRHTSRSEQTSLSPSVPPRPVRALGA